MEILHRSENGYPRFIFWTDLYPKGYLNSKQIPVYTDPKEVDTWNTKPLNEENVLSVRPWPSTESKVLLLN